MRVEIKGGVSLLGLTTQALVGMWIAAELWAEMFPQYPFVLTEGSDRPPGVRGRNRVSLHFQGNAFDLRARDPRGAWALTDDERNGFARQLKPQLGDEFDVVARVTPPGVHVEWQPKGG